MVYIQLLRFGNPTTQVSSLISGLKNEYATSCVHENLKTKKENAIPYGYGQDVFCAQNTNKEHSTCPGDSGE